VTDLSILRQIEVRFIVTRRPETCIQWSSEGFRKAADVFLLHEIEPSQVNDRVWFFSTHRFPELKDRHESDDWLCT
jgi:hypothetical protein